MIKRTLMRITQPIGDFFIGKMWASEIKNISEIKRLTEDPEGIQRRLTATKISSIKKDCEDPDVVFPTSIVLAVKQKSLDALKPIQDTEDLWTFEYNEEETIAEIIDGQHRIVGISEAIAEGHADIELPVVLMFNATKEQKAYVFASINSNQTKVNKSTIYELFRLYETRSPFKTCHVIARAFNSSKSSPFYRRLAMFGIKKNGLESLTQGTFVDEILTLITSNSDTAKRDAINIKTGQELKNDDKRPLRRYFIDDKDEYISKILLNYFSAVANVFQDEWKQPDKYILTKTTGFGALVSLFRKLCMIGLQQKNLSYDFFFDIFTRIKDRFDLKNIELTSFNYGSGKFAQRQLRDEFLKALNVKDTATSSENGNSSKKQFTRQDLYLIAMAEDTARRVISKKARKALKNLMAQKGIIPDAPEEAIGMLDFLDDETAEHFYQLSPENQSILTKKIKNVSARFVDKFKQLRALHENDYADDQELLDNKQSIINTITDGVAKELKEFLM